MTDGQDGLAAVNIELFVYKLVLCAIILPIFDLISPIFLIQQAVVDAYRLIRRTAFVAANLDLPQVEQIRFEGYAFFHVAGLVTLTLLLTFIVGYLRSAGPGRSQRTLPDAPRDRRFRDLPASVRARIEARVDGLWPRIGAGEAPDVACFASTGLAACVIERNARPAVALSTGLIDRIGEHGDRLSDAILLHELAHIVGRDGRLFRRSTAFVGSFRLTFTILIVALALTSIASSFGEIWNLGGIEQRSPSPAAFLIDVVRNLIFPYASMVLTLRYVALIIMLTELRADLRAALAIGGLAPFADAVRDAQGFRPSSRVHILRSWIGTRVSHLTAQERLDLLQRPRRLLTPKYRYFLASIALSILLVIDGALAFSGFDWVLQVGIIASVAALNAITVSMVMALAWDGRPVTAVPRLAWIATIVVAANSLFLFSSSAVMGTTGELVTAYFDPNFASDETALHDAYDAWCTVVGKPVVDAMADGRFLLWSLSVLGALLTLRALLPARRGQTAVVGAGLATALTSAIVAAGAPIATYLLLPSRLLDLREPIIAAMMRFGPALPVVAGTVIGLALGADGSAPSWRSLRRSAR